MISPSRVSMKPIEASWLTGFYISTTKPDPFNLEEYQLGETKQKCQLICQQVLPAYLDS